MPSGGCSKLTGDSSVLLECDWTPGLLGVDGGVLQGDAMVLNPGLFGEGPGRSDAGAKAKLA